MIFQISRLIFCLLLCLFGWQTVVSAASLTAYRQKIQEVSKSVTNLNYSEDSLTEAENIAQTGKFLQGIRAKLPATEKIELKETTFEVNHNWFLEKLKEFENESYYSTKRTPIVDELSERLATLASKLIELENQEVSNRTKDQDKQKLNEILTREEYQPPQEKEETWLQRNWREFWEWFWSVNPKRERQMREEEPQGSPLLSSVLLYIIIGIALLGIGFLIYRFAPFIAKRIREREKKEKKSRVILGETISADETSYNIFTEAENLARDGNLRGAIRKGYIALLCELSDRKLIALAGHKTNRDYLRDVRKQKELHQNMNVLTSNFERNWYGSKKTDDGDWEEFKQNYQQAMRQKT